MIQSQHRARRSRAQPPRCPLQTPIAGPGVPVLPDQHKSGVSAAPPQGLLIARTTSELRKALYLLLLFIIKGTLRKSQVEERHELGRGAQSLHACSPAALLSQPLQVFTSQEAQRLVV